MAEQFDRVILSRRAFDELDQILAYIARESASNAAKVIDRIQSAIASLSELPYRYRTVQGRSTAPRAVRRMPVPPFLVYYEVIALHRTVRVLTIRHARQKQPRRFR